MDWIRGRRRVAGSGSEPVPDGPVESAGVTGLVAPAPLVGLGVALRRIGAAVEKRLPEYYPEWLVALLGPLWLVARRLDALLRLFHDPGERGYGLEGLADPETAPVALGNWGVGVLGPRVTTDIDGQTIAVVAIAVSIVVWLMTGGLWWWAQSRVVRWGREPAPIAAVNVSVVLGGVAFGLHLLERASALIMIWIESALPMWMLGPLGLARTIKSMLVVLAAMLFVYGAWALRRERLSRKESVSELSLAVRDLRVPTMIVGLYVVFTSFGFPSEQAQDAVRFWVDEAQHGLYSLASVLLLSAALAIAVSRTITGRVVDRTRTGWGVYAGGGAAVGCLGLALLQLELSVGPAIAVLGGVLSAVGLVSLAVEKAADPSDLERSGGTGDEDRSTPDGGTRAVDDATRHRLIRWYALAPWAATAGLIAVSGISHLIAEGFQPVLLIWFALFVAMALVVPYVLPTDRDLPLLDRPGVDSDTRRPTWVVVVVVLGCVAGTVALALGAPFRVPLHVGAVALFVWFLALAVAVLSLAAHFVESKAAPAGLILLGFRRTPLLSLLLVWFVLGSLVDRQSSLHDVRTVPAAHHTIGLDDYYDEWLAGAPPRGDGEVVPLVLVATHGGGIKAAAWTSMVLDCAFGTRTLACPEPVDRAGDEAWAGTGAVFAMSGASGGTVGLQTFANEHLSSNDETWAKRRAAGDLLSPLLARMLFVEAPAALVGYQGFDDRGAILERTWSRQWSGVEADPRCGIEGPLGEDPYTGRYRAWTGDGIADCRVPVILAGGVSLNDGCFVNISVFVDRGVPNDSSCGGVRAPSTVDASAGVARALSRDGIRFLCDGRDLPASTAAFLSARFPFVSPTGRLPRMEETENGCVESGDAINVGDGGYRDNTGAAALVDLLISLEPLLERSRADGVCVVPVVLEVQSGYRDETGQASSRRLHESVGPLSGALAVFGSRDRHEPERLRSMVEIINGASTYYLSVGLSATPDIQAPLGWLLSDEATDALEEQLKHSRNWQALRDLDEVLGGELGCPDAEGSGLSG